MWHHGVLRCAITLLFWRASMVDVKREKLDLRVRGVDLRISSMHRQGVGEPIVFLHGFGSTKEDYADIARLSAFDGRPFIAYDAPGCGESECGEPSAISVPFLVDTARAVLGRFEIERLHLVGLSYCASASGLRFTFRL